MRKNPRQFVRRVEEAQHKINEKITAHEVRIVFDGKEPEVMSTAKAIALAEEEELDLVEILVVRIIRCILILSPFQKWII